jgi:hypothetical protein
MTKQSKILIGAVTAISCLFAYWAYRDIQAEQIRAEDSRQIIKEIDSLFDFMIVQNYHQDVESIGQTEWGTMPKIGIVISLRPNMDHSATRRKFPNHQWKKWQVAFREAHPK